MADSAPSTASKLQRAVVGLGVARDGVEVGDAGVQVGFGIAERCVDMGFGIGRLGLRTPARFLHKAIPYNPVSLCLSAADHGVGYVHQGVRGCMGISKTITRGCLKTTSFALELCGGQEGETQRLLHEDLGMETAGALVTVLRVVLKFVAPLDRAQLLNVTTNTRKLQDHQQDVASRRTPTPITTVDVEMDLHRYIHFAVAAYDMVALRALGVLGTDGPVPSRVAGISTLTGIDPSDVMQCEASSDTYRPGYYIAIDHDRRKVVVVFRGTLRVVDVLTDLVCEPAAAPELPDCPNVHQGFLLTGTRLVAELTDVVSAALSRDDTVGYGVVVCGHSLGAATATAVTLLWRSQGAFPGTSLHCWAYAAPCVVSLACARAAEGYITSVVVGDDIVPRLTLASAERLRTALLEGAIRTGPSVHCPHKELYPAGRIIHIHPETGHMEGWHHTDLCDMVVSGTMLAHHLPHVYQNACAARMDDLQQAAE